MSVSAFVCFKSRIAETILIQFDMNFLEEVILRDITTCLY
jgi:hypothetical protein